MTAPAIDHALRGVFTNVLGVAVPAPQDLERAQCAAWNSIRHIELLFAVEAAFQVRFSENDIGELASLHAVAKRVAELHAA